MNTTIEISVAKLSEPVEALCLDRRTCLTLRRGKVYTVAEVVLRGKPQLSSIHNLGALTADRIWQALALYLGLSEEQLATETTAISEAVWDAPIHVLPLLPSRLNDLAWLGYSRIEDLMRDRANPYSYLQSIDAHELFEFERHLHGYLAGAAQEHLLRVQRDHLAPASSSLQTSAVPASVPGPQLPLDARRSWSILECRAIQCLPLPEICIRLGLSKFQVRRGMYQAQTWLRDQVNNQRPFLDHLEERSRLLAGSLETGSLDLRDLVRHLSAHASNANLAVPETDVERTILVVRTLAMSLRGWLWSKMKPKWPMLIQLSCMVTPTLTPREHVEQIRMRKERGQQKKTVLELVYEVLAGAGAPLHWSQVAGKVAQLDGGHSVRVGQVHWRLRKHRELFARAAGGYYTLVESSSPAV